MYLLAFESSCDDTSVALLRNEELVSMRTHTQLEHIATQGVVPEVAARLHANHIFGLIDEVLAEAKVTMDEIDMFAATKEPGLVPSLLIGKTVAKTLAISHKKPIIWVNHIEGHIFSLLLERKLNEIQFPVIVLSASGGHNDLFLWHSLYHIEKIGGTVDDSAGESMDKVGRSLGLPFPAGRHIDELAQKYDAEIHTNIPYFPLVLPAESLNFSFSGLKSAAIREIDIRKKLKNAPLTRSSTLSEQYSDKLRLEEEEESQNDIGGLEETDLVEISYGYQETITKILSERLIEALKKTGAKSMALVGGVSANSRLRAILESYSKAHGIPYFVPKSLKYCGDNAAMIGMKARYDFLKQQGE